MRQKNKSTSIGPENSSYQSSGPYQPATMIGDDGIVRPTKGPPAGPVFGFSIQACCSGFCHCIYDMIVFIFCCGFCFWCIHCCCHDDDQQNDNINQQNQSNANYNKIPDNNKSSNIIQQQHLQNPQSSYPTYQSSLDSSSQPKNIISQTNDTSLDIDANKTNISANEQYLI